MTSTPQKILEVWSRFDSSSMETLTKAWCVKHHAKPRQRSAAALAAHKHRYEAHGNCFDLAVSLIDKFTHAGIEAYGVGHDLHSQEAHIGVIAHGVKGERYLCDLGDVWLQPLLIDSTRNKNDGLRSYFPAAEISFRLESKFLHVSYLRPNGKTSRQAYDLTPVRERELRRAGDYSQNYISHALVETRLERNGEMVHWEFGNDLRSFISSSQGKFYEADLRTHKEMGERIADRTGINADYAEECLDIIKKHFST
jgi:hypothetical protein